jgi:glyoxylase-like metal-dependent hydrolase (beta-lactamase superfamily II)
MKLHAALFLVGVLVSATAVAPTAVALAADQGQVTILYDAFGKDAAMKKDWGFSALVEVLGKRILFDTGNDPEVFASNVKAKNVDLTNLDFVVLSHRHSDHMAGLSYVLSVNPKVKIFAPKEGFGIYGSSLPSSFYKRQADCDSGAGHLLATIKPKIVRHTIILSTNNLFLLTPATSLSRRFANPAVINLSIRSSRSLPSTFRVIFLL